MSDFYTVDEISVGSVIRRRKGADYYGEYFLVHSLECCAPGDNDARVFGEYTDGSQGQGPVPKDKNELVFITWDEAVELYNKRHDQRQAAKNACDELRRCSGGKCDSGCDDKCDECDCDDRWNTTCNKCGSPAYHGLTFECSNPDCGGGY